MQQTKNINQSNGFRLFNNILKAVAFVTILGNIVVGYKFYQFYQFNQLSSANAVTITDTPEFVEKFKDIKYFNEVGYYWSDFKGSETVLGSYVALHENIYLNPILKSTALSVDDKTFILAHEFTHHLDFQKDLNLKQFYGLVADNLNNQQKMELLTDYVAFRIMVVAFDHEGEFADLIKTYLTTNSYNALEADSTFRNYVDSYIKTLI